LRKRCKREQNNEGVEQFHWLRDTRTLSLIYLCAFAIFLFSTALWTILNGSLAFQDNLLGSSTEAIASALSLAIIPGLSLVAICVIAIALLKNALKQRQFGTLGYAVICLALGIAGIYQEFPLSFGPDYPLMSLIWPGSS
jgi:hypothetical protein